MRNIRVFLGAVILAALAVLGSFRIVTPSVGAVGWPPAGKHPGMQYATDGRPKFMVKEIDFVNNEIVFAYLKDGETEAVPKSVGVAWFETEWHWRQDTSQIERMDDGLNQWTQVVEARYEDWEEVGREGDLIYYRVGNLERNLGDYDPTGKWMYYLRFDDGTTWTDGNTFWNARVDYTQCIIEYRDVVGDVLGHEGQVLIKAECQGDYNERGEVEYTLVTEFGPGSAQPNPADGGEIDPGFDIGEPGIDDMPEIGDEPGIDNGLGLGDEPGIDDVPEIDGGAEADNGGEVVVGAGESIPSESAGSESANDADWNVSRVEMMPSSGGQEVWTQLAQAGDGEYRMTVTRNGENEVTVFENIDKEAKTEDNAAIAQDGGVGETRNEGEVMVPELGGATEESSWDEIKRWLVPVMAGLAAGATAWWVIPIILRRRREKEEAEK